MKQQKAGRGTTLRLPEDVRSLSPNLFQITDTCNVYLVKRGTSAVAIDFGSGAWLPALRRLGIRRLEHVFLTHHHADQCSGLAGAGERPFTVHAPAGEARFLDPAQATEILSDKARINSGCPPSYAVLPGGLRNVVYDMAGFSDVFWGDARIRFLHTPGHSPNACSVLMDVDGAQVVFCGDACHAGGTIWQPFHLEWDHWTGGGALAAWEGIERLRGLRIDRLCSAHGPAIASPQRDLATLSRRLLAFYRAKGQIASDEPDRYLPPQMVPGGRRLLPNLYQFGVNGYLLCSSNGEGLVVDPYVGDMDALRLLLAGLPGCRPTAAVATHYHGDHCDAMPQLRAQFGTVAWLHPQVVFPLREHLRVNVPWLPETPILADHVWPVRGTWQWNEFSFRIAEWPGQTWGHCLFMTEVAGQKVAFAGDSFQPPSRWNGTGGFCAFNRSRFAAFAASSRRIRAWKPDIVACGHATYCSFAAGRFAKIERWARAAERATRALCPGRDLQRHYYNDPPIGSDGVAGFAVW